MTTRCHSCTAPLDEGQRYCVICGASRRDPHDPVARYLARPVPAVPAPATVRRPAPDHRMTAIALALLPIAAAAGVLVGRAGNDDNDKLIAAIKAQKPVAVAAAPAGAAADPVRTEDTAALTSDFKGSKGFVVQLQTLPAGTDGAAVAKAEAAAKAKGVKDVGLLVTSDFTLTPSTSAPALIYSGPFRTKAEAAKALGKIKQDFKGAKIVAVKRGAPTAQAHTAPATPQSVQAEANATDAQLVAPPSAAQKDAGAQVVQDIQSKVGKSYVEQQQQLPDTIVVP
jgi:hypothetical protein